MNYLLAIHNSLLRSLSGLHLRDRLREKFAHAGADLLPRYRKAPGREVARQLSDDGCVAAFAEGLGNRLTRIGGGGFSREAEFLGGPQAEQAVSAGYRLELQLLIDRKFLLESFLALVESGHGRVPSRSWNSASTCLVAAAPSPA